MNHKFSFNIPKLIVGSCCLIAVAFAFAATPGLLRAQTPSTGPSVAIATAWDGLANIPSWSELLITLTNEGEDWEGDLVVENPYSQVTYHQSLSLPGHSNKQYRMPIWMDNQQVKVRLTSATSPEQIINIMLHERPDSGVMCVILDSLGRIGESGIEGCAGIVVLTDISRLPETPLAWEVVDRVILNGLPTADLTPAQREALLAWVSWGGQLLVSGGASLPQTLEGLPERLRIAAIGETQVERVPELSASEITLATLLPGIETRIQMTSKERAIAVQKVIGMGLVEITGWDWAQVESQALTDYLARLPIPSLNHPLGLRMTDMVSTVNNAVTIPFKTLSGALGWACGIPLYIFMMGPGSLLIVRRLRRPILAWVLLPTWIVLALIWMLLSLRGALVGVFPLRHETAMITVPGPDLPARVTQIDTIYAPQSGKLSWTTSGAPRHLWGLITDSYYSSGTPYPLFIDRMDAQTTRLQTNNLRGIFTVLNEGMLPSYPYPELSLDYASSGLSGVITSPISMHAAGFWYGQRQIIYPFEDNIEAGKPYVFSNLSITSVSTFDYQHPCRYEDPAITTSAIPNPNVCMVSGVVDETPYPVYSMGARVAQSCIYYIVPCPPDQRISSFNEVEMDNTNSGDFWKDESGVYHLYTYMGSITLYFAPPPFVMVDQIRTIAITINPIDDSGNPTTTTNITNLALWDFERSAWEPVDFELDKTNYITNSDIENYLGDGDSLQLQISTDPNKSSANFKLKVTISSRAKTP